MRTGDDTTISRATLLQITLNDPLGAAGLFRASTSRAESRADVCITVDGQRHEYDMPQFLTLLGIRGRG